MAQRPEELVQDEMDEGTDTEEEEEEERVLGKVSAQAKGKTRRKANQRPEGSDQKRQAFSKRKRGLILKSYQLYRLTDAKVFVFIVNDKGTSWAYATPGFKQAVKQEHLQRMREYANLTGNQRLSTEIMGHPSKVKNDPVDRRADERCMRNGGDGDGGGAEEVSDGAPAFIPHAGTAAAAMRAASRVPAAAAAGLGEHPPMPSAPGLAVDPLVAAAATAAALARVRGGPGGNPGELQFAAMAPTGFLPVASAALNMALPVLLPLPERHEGPSDRAAAVGAGEVMHRLPGAGPLGQPQVLAPPHMGRDEGPEATGGEGAPQEEPGPRQGAMQGPDFTAQAPPNTYMRSEVVLGDDGQLYRILYELPENEELEASDVELVQAVPVSQLVQRPAG